MYDSLFQPSDDIKIFKDAFIKILSDLKIYGKIITYFDVVYFLNPANINMRKLLNTVNELKKKIKKQKKKME